MSSAAPNRALDRPFICSHSQNSGGADIVLRRP